MSPEIQKGPLGAPLHDILEPVATPHLRAGRAVDRSFWASRGSLVRLMAGEQ